MLKKTITSAAVPVRAVIDGSPVLAARLWAPASARLDKASTERAAIAKALAETREAELAKLTDEKAIAKARAAHAEADKATRAAKREQIGSALGGGALVAVVAGPVSWHLVGPWMPVATWSGIGLWCLAAMAHSPKIATAGEQGEELDEELDDVAADAAADADEDQEQPEAVRSPTLGPDELTTAVERMVAIRAQSDGGAGKILLSEVLSALQHHGLYPGQDTREFGAVVRAAGLPVEKRVRVGKAVSPGFSVEGLTAHLGTAPLPPATGAPQPLPAKAV